MAVLLCMLVALVCAIGVFWGCVKMQSEQRRQDIGIPLFLAFLTFAGVGLFLGVLSDSATEASMTPQQLIERKENEVADLMRRRDSYTDVNVQLDLQSRIDGLNREIGDINRGIEEANKANPALPSSDVSAAPIELAAKAEIPADLSYSVERTENEAPFKRTLTVRLNRVVNEEILRAVALVLNSSDRDQYNKTFIFYYLPGIVPGKEDPWATSHFTPQLEVKILGFTEGQLSALCGNDPTPAGSELVGEWFKNSFTPSRLRILRRGETYILNTRLTDGHQDDAELETKVTDEGAWYANKDRAPGDYWLVNKEGALERRDGDGLIFTANRVELLIGKQVLASRSASLPVLPVAKDESITATSQVSESVQPPEVTSTPTPIPARALFVLEMHAGRIEFRNTGKTDLFLKEVVIKFKSVWKRKEVVRVGRTIAPGDFYSIYAKSSLKKSDTVEFMTDPELDREHLATSIMP